MIAPKRCAAVGLVSLCLALIPSGVASAQTPAEASPTTPPAPVTNCYPLQGLLLSPCTVPINVGPFGPFVFFPNGLGSPQP